MELRIYKIIGIIALLSLVSCTKQQGPVEPEIDITTVSYQTDIHPIFDNNCTSCHKAELEQTFGELNLEADKSYIELVGIDAVFEGTSLKRVQANDFENSVLWLKINESNSLGANMPLGQTPITKHEQDLIKIWINEGALDN
jgi:uncharacterized membrane protein